MALDLEAHKGKSEVEDFNTILASLLPDDGDGVIVAPGVAEAFLKYSKGNYRRMFKLARGVVRASAIGNQGISVKLIETYAQLLIH